LDFGPGVITRGIVSHTPGEVIAAVDVTADAPLGKHEITLLGSRFVDGIAIYDRIDYIKVTPETALATFGDQTRPRGFEPFAATGYQRGPDGKLHTDDDVDLGPVDVAWSLQVFYAADGSRSDYVGTMSPSGLFIPARVSPNSNVDTWAVATARNEKDGDGQLLVGKAYLVVTVPTYTLNGRRYVRDLGRWIDDGPASDGRPEADK
jgi:quinohemoprotein amine dehydrogenase